MSLSIERSLFSGNNTPSNYAWDSVINYLLGAIGTIPNSEFQSILNGLQTFADLGGLSTQFQKLESDFSIYEQNPQYLAQVKQDLSQLPTPQLSQSDYYACMNNLCAALNTAVSQGEPISMFIAVMDKMSQFGSTPLPSQWWQVRNSSAWSSICSAYENANPPSSLQIAEMENEIKSLQSAIYPSAAPSNNGSVSIPWSEIWNQYMWPLLEDQTSSSMAEFSAILNGLAPLAQMGGAKCWAAFQKLQTDFNAYNNNPTPANWKALDQDMNTIQNSPPQISPENFKYAVNDLLAAFSSAVQSGSNVVIFANILLAITYNSPYLSQHYSGIFCSTFAGALNTYEEAIIRGQKPTPQMIQNLVEQINALQQAALDS